MAILGGNNPTLMDVARRTDGNGKIAKIVEMLSEQNAILDDMVFEMCNNGSSHKTTVRTGLHEAVCSKLYEGVPSSKSTTEYGFRLTASVSCPPSSYPTYPGGAPISLDTLYFS